MNAPRPVVVLVPIASGDNGAWRRSRPDFRRHKAQRTEPHRPPQPIPERDIQRLRQLAEDFRRATRSQAEALLAAGRLMLSGLGMNAAGVLIPSRPPSKTYTPRADPEAAALPVRIASHSASLNPDR
jgi:hypothetical protein